MGVTMSNSFMLSFSTSGFSRSVRIAENTIKHSADSVRQTIELLPWWFYIPVAIVLLKLVVLPIFNTLFPFGRKG